VKGRLGGQRLVEESELEYNTTTRELTITGGSRKESAVEHNPWIIPGFIALNPGCSQQQVVDAFSKQQSVYEPISDKPARDAIRHGIKSGRLHPGMSPKGRAMQLTVIGPNVDPGAPGWESNSPGFTDSRVGG
jgi:hypothetical protein